ncbi:hypothetical protein WICPIJ_002172 [Wickerhamomyces pijperi]|uniref:Uncharacterized protein n=1 Tax=Wickerhamomyces pijperi TaxID=599730 RepID=A0A9P8QC89_WICPI|nr:hypothetical protein WICPIJ_002172 [Wickerhamomyces pijperi]
MTFGSAKGTQCSGGKRVSSENISIVVPVHDLLFNQHRHHLSRLVALVGDGLGARSQVGSITDRTSTANGRQQAGVLDTFSEDLNGFLLHQLIGAQSGRLGVTFHDRDKHLQERCTDRKVGVVTDRQGIAQPDIDVRLQKIRQAENNGVRDHGDLVSDGKRVLLDVRVSFHGLEESVEVHTEDAGLTGLQLFLVDNLGSFQGQLIQQARQGFGTLNGDVQEAVSDLVGGLDDQLLAVCLDSLEHRRQSDSELENVGVDFGNGVHGLRKQVCTFNQIDTHREHNQVVGTVHNVLQQGDQHLDDCQVANRQHGGRLAERANDWLDELDDDREGLRIHLRRQNLLGVFSGDQALLMEHLQLLLDEHFNLVLELGLNVLWRINTDQDTTGSSQETGKVSKVGQFLGGHFRVVGSSEMEPFVKDVIPNSDQSLGGNIDLQEVLSDDFLQGNPAGSQDIGPCDNSIEVTVEEVAQTIRTRGVLGKFSLKTSDGPHKPTANTVLKHSDKQFQAFLRDVVEIGQELGKALQRQSNTNVAGNGVLRVIWDTCDTDEAQEEVPDSSRQSWMVIKKGDQDRIHQFSFKAH